MQDVQGFEAFGLEGIGSLDAVLIRRDGSRHDLGCISGPHNYRLIGRPVQWGSILQVTRDR